MTRLPHPTAFGLLMNGAHITSAPFFNAAAWLLLHPRWNPATIYLFAALLAIISGTLFILAGQRSMYPITATSLAIGALALLFGALTLFIAASLVFAKPSPNYQFVHITNGRHTNTVILASLASYLLAFGGKNMSKRKRAFAVASDLRHFLKNKDKNNLPSTLITPLANHHEAILEAEGFTLVADRTLWLQECWGFPIIGLMAAMTGATPKGRYQKWVRPAKQPSDSSDQL